MKTYTYILEKYKLSPRREHFIEIPNITRNDLAKLFFELGFTTGAEIGVENGAYSEVLCKENPNLKLFCIDPYTPAAYEPGIDAIDYRHEHFKKTYKTAKKTLSKYSASIIKKPSQEAINDFSDNSLDFVYIDGNHSFKDVTNDIHEWKKKVKVGGIISGHDFAYYPAGRQNHVKHALLSYTKAYGIKPLFIVGSGAVNKPNVARDRFRSWFFVKK